jgi:hypothetical protein
MIGHQLANTNEGATVANIKKNSHLNEGATVPTLFDTVVFLFLFGNNCPNMD